MKLKLMRSGLKLYDKFMKKFFYDKEIPKSNKPIKNVPYGNKKFQNLDIYSPIGTGKAPAIVYVHGGGWFGGDKKNFERFCKWLSSQGYLVFCINYRLTPENTFPLQIHDLAKAIDWAVANTRQYGGDNEQLILAGESTGANLVAWYAAALHKPDLANFARLKDMIKPEILKGLLCFYGVYDLDTMKEIKLPVFPFMAEIVDGYLGPIKDDDKRREVIHNASPIRHIRTGYPPTFVASGEVDPVHSESAAFVEKLTNMNVQVQKIFFPATAFPEAHHGFLNDPLLNSSKKAYHMISSFLKSITTRSDKPGEFGAQQGFDPSTFMKKKP
ncbi:MAG: alpha/beta hydrolase [Vulcanimicrobiota bacterium]